MSCDGSCELDVLIGDSCDASVRGGEALPFSTSRSIRGEGVLAPASLQFVPSCGARTEARPT